MHPARFASAVTSLALSLAAVAQTPGFWLTGLSPGTDQGSVTGLSQDGSMAAGYTANGMTLAAPGFTWTAAGGRDDFGLLPGMPFQTVAYGMSSDGGTIVGFMGGPTAPRRAFRRIGTGPLVDLGSSGYQSSAASSVSGDGSVVVGFVSDGSGSSRFGQAFRWTQTGGMQLLGRPAGTQISYGQGVSRDGTTVVGYSDGIAPQALVWRQSTGMQPLLPPTGWSTFFSTAYGANSDGSIIVGQTEAPDTSFHFTRWVNGVPESLGYGSATCVSDDGSVIAGSANVAAVWTQATGVIPLTDYLAPYGVTIPAGWTVRDIFAISGDGLTFAGDAFNGSQIQGFVASVTAPTGTVVVFCSALLAARRRASTRGARPSPIRSATASRERSPVWRVPSVEEPIRSKSTRQCTGPS